MTKRIAILVAAAAAVPGSLPAQSLLNAAGFGLPSLSVDARARALGGVGIGLTGPSLTAADPAAAAWFGLPGVTMTAQPSWVDAEFEGGATSNFKGTRFPLMGIAYPAFGAGVVTLSMESFVDQRFEATRPITVDIGEGPIEASDEFVSEGGVSQVRLGFARTVGSNLALGLSVGRYAGSVTRRLTRAVLEDSTTAGPSGFDPYTSGGVWGYSGTNVTAGASVSLGGFAQVAGSMTWSGTLSAEASDDTDGQDRSFEVPLQLRVGASAVLAPGLSLNAGLATSDWSGIDDDLEVPASSGGSTTYGFGLELTRARLFGRSAPLRFGYRHADLPFSLYGASPTESVLSGGLGLALSEIGEIVRAAVDLSIEKGTREDANLTETFWRAALTLRLSGL